MITYVELFQGPQVANCTRHRNIYIRWASDIYMYDIVWGGYSRREQFSDSCRVPSSCQVQILTPSILMPTKLYIREVTIAPQQLMGVRIMDHTPWWPDIERQIKGIQGVQVTIHQKIASVTSHFPPWNASIAMLILSTNEDSLPSPF